MKIKCLSVESERFLLVTSSITRGVIGDSANKNPTEQILKPAWMLKLDTDLQLN